MSECADSAGECPDVWLGELNPKQREAVTYGGGPLLIIAGAGTGKTKTLAYRVAWLIRQGVPADRILLLTFTRRAAEEMLNRARQAIKNPSLNRVWGGTFHAVANRLLRMYGKAIKLAPDFTVMDESDSQDLLGLVRAKLGFSSKEKRFPRKATILKIYSRVMNSRAPLSRVLERDYPWCVHAEEGLRQIFAQYSVRKQERQLLDYDDLLLFWNAMLESPEIADRMGEMFEHVLVDEYQDTNIIQAEILQRLRKNNQNITVVGDDAQSIYAFRAATIRNILCFPEQFPGAKIVTLEENYRSVQPVLEVGNQVMRSARYRYTKNLWSRRKSAQRPILVCVQDEAEQCRVVCEQVLKHQEEGVRLQEQAVLFRAGHHSDQLEIELKRRDIPFHKFGGLKFLEAAHVKDLVAFLRIFENPRDEVSWSRVLEMFDGVGPKTVRRFLDDFDALDWDMKRLSEVLMPVAAGMQYKALTELVAKILNEEKMPITDQIHLVRQFYDPFIELLYENPEPRRRDLEQLEEIARRYRSRQSFITDLTLDPPDSTADLAGPPHKDDDWLVLSTMHSAKGCEWKVVYIIHAADGNIPSDMALGGDKEVPDEDALEEERRLFYVAITRAKDWLYIFFPLRYYFRRYRMGDGHSYAQISRFVDEDVAELMERRIADDFGLRDVPIELPTATEIWGKLRKPWEE